MYQIGVINQNYSEDEIKQLCSNFFSELDCKVSRIDDRDISQGNINFDVVFIFSDSSLVSMSDTCSTIIKIRDTMDAYTLVYQKKADLVNRIIYLQLGANLNVGEGTQPKEIQLTIQNELKYRTKKVHTYMKHPSLNENESVNNTPDIILELERKVNFTRKEYELLYLLKSDIGRTFTHQEIYESIWKKVSSNPKPRVANVVFALREKLEKNGYPAEDYIQTVHGFGYKMANLDL